MRITTAVFPAGRAMTIHTALALGLPNEPWGGDFVFKQIGENFTPALGFINRTGIRQYDGSFTHLNRYRGMFLNQLEFDTNYEFVTDMQNRLESRANDITARAASTAGDELTLKLINNEEDVPVAFFLPGRVPVSRTAITPGPITSMRGPVPSTGVRPYWPSIPKSPVAASTTDNRCIPRRSRLSYRPECDILNSCQAMRRHIHLACPPER